MDKYDIISKPEETIASQVFWNMGYLARKLLFATLSVGPIPKHIAFIMDGNRRYAKKWNLTEGGGHNDGFLAVIRMLKYCYELGVTYVTVYAFSIDNYRRKPREVALLMNMMQIKMEELVEVEGFVQQFGVRIYFSGNLRMLSEPVKKAVNRVMLKTAKNTGAVLSICVAYTSTDEITNSISQCYEEKVSKKAVEAAGCGRIELGDVERNMYMGVAPDPEILVRTSGETRLSNFLLWQSGSSLLYSPSVLWPEIGLLHLLWAVLKYQRSHSYLMLELQLCIVHK